MFRVTREIGFCYGHRLLNYQGKCRHLHGHNGRAIITLESAQLDERGMVFDFGDLKRIVGGWIDSYLDHRMLLHMADPVAKYLEQMGEPLCLIDRNPTAENIAQVIFNFTADHGFPVVEVRLWETATSFATFCPGGQAQARSPIRVRHVNVDCFMAEGSSPPTGPTGSG